MSFPTQNARGIVLYNITLLFVNMQKKKKCFQNITVSSYNIHFVFHFLIRHSKSKDIGRLGIEETVVIENRRCSDSSDGFSCDKSGINQSVESY